MGAVGTLALAARELAIIAESLATSLEVDARGGFLLSLGLRPPIGLLDLPDVGTAMDAVASAAAAASSASTDLTNAIASADAALQAERAATLLLSLSGFAVALEQLRSALTSAATALPELTAQERADLQAFAQSLFSNLFDQLLTSSLPKRSPLLSVVLLISGVVAIVDEPGDAPTGLRVARVTRTLRLDRLGPLLQDPWGQVGALYGWGDQLFDGLGLLRVVQAILADNGRTAELMQPPGLPASLDAGVFQLEVDDTTSPPGLLADLRFPAQISTEETFSADGGWSATSSVAVEAEADVTIAVLPPLQLRIQSGADAQLSLTVQATRADAGVPFVLIGAADDGSRLEVNAVDLQVTVTCGAVGVESPTPVAIQARAALQGGRLVLGGDGDALWQRAFGGSTNAARFDLTMTWSPENGLELDGHARIEADLAAHHEIGPVYIDAVRIALTPGSSSVGVAVTVSAGGRLGPVTLSFGGVGVHGDLSIPASTGNLGFVQLDVGWQSPSSVGIAVDASMITGGGSLSVDTSTGTYAGTLTLQGVGIALSAAALITTRPELSLVAIISTQFAPIQLGLGFTLNGVGGLIAIDRRVNTDVLRAALRGPGIDNIFFASDPSGQASRLLGDLATYFPTAPGRYVFGPAAKLGWGTPTVVEAELAVLLEMPAPVRVVLLGSMHTKLPTKDHPLITLQVDVVGELDVTEKRLAIDASLRDSSVVGFPIIGDMALRASWGDQKVFILSVGGFHSQFRPPPDFPTLRRVRIPIGADDDPRLDVTGFLAVTSNTVQIGAQVELYASEGPLNVTGSVAFEALFQRSPLSFEADLSAGVSLRRGTTVLAGVHLDGTLTGPTPWHVAGEACLSLWLVDLCVDFSASFGTSQPVELPSIAILPVLLPALQDPASWASSLVTGVASVVTTAPAVDATAAQSTATRLEPTAALTVRQSIVPFDRPITKFAQSRPTDVSQVMVTLAMVGGSSVSFTPVTDWFAPADFEDLSEADRLSRDGFEQMDAGVSLAGDAVAAGVELVVPLEYETVIVAPATPPTGLRFRPTLASQLLAGQTGTSESGPQLVAHGGLPEETFVIASITNLGARLDLATPGTRGNAELALAAHIAANPADADAFVVVPMFEAA